MMRIVLAIVAVIIGGVVAAALAGSARWDRQTTAVVGQLVASGGPEVYRGQWLDDLPTPVQRYFRKVLKDDQPIVHAVVATQEAEFFINGAWRPLRATQHFVTRRPGFVWDARITMAPMLPASVRDAYIDGRGAMQASLYGVYSLADQVDKPELNSGALQRFLGEAVWFPTALLPSPTVTWQPRDNQSAVVTLHDHGTSVALLFEFDDTGMVRTISGDRYKEANGAYVMQGWEIACDEAAERGGMLIPLRCEVAWVDGGVRQPYWRGRITAIEHQYN
jgi:hypothetical protein